MCLLPEANQSGAHTTQPLLYPRAGHRAARDSRNASELELTKLPGPQPALPASPTPPVKTATEALAHSSPSPLSHDPSWSFPKWF